MPAGLKAEEPTVINEPADDSAPLTATLTIRGRVYTFRELLTDEYDKLVRMAADEDDLVDRTLLLRLMIVEASVDPRLTPDKLAKLPYPVSRRIGVLVNDMHYSNDAPQEDGEERPKP